MKIIFLSLSNTGSLKSHGIYQDLLRMFVQNGHEVYALSPSTTYQKGSNTIVKENGIIAVYAYTGKIMKTNIIKKGINTLLIAPRFKRAVKKNFNNVRFDLVLYPTPPITLMSAVKYLKNRDNARTYLMLKDIFPQNAVDLGMINKNGPMGLIYSYFRGVERQLYLISDKIGCMSPANVDYLLAHNPEIPKEKVELCPNSIEVQDLSLSAQEKTAMRERYHLPTDKKIFVYGGNFGKPQGISFVIECLKKQINNPDAFFLLVGSGTEYGALKRFVDESGSKNVCLMERLPRDEYDRMIAACDIGMIFLAHQFTIPNFPNRLLSYMQAKLPVLASTDPNTDVGKVIIKGGFGWWCESNDTEGFAKLINECINYDTSSMGESGYQYLTNHYNVGRSYKTIMEFLNEGRDELG